MDIGGFVKYSGTFLGMNLKDFDAHIESTLEAIGEKGIEVMKENMEHKDYTGNTRGSVMYRTKATYKRPDKTEFIIDAPSKENEVDIGSANPVATYIEYGTPAHQRSNNWEEFVAAIKEWAQTKGIPEEAVFPIIRKIHNEGTVAYPFAEKTKLDMLAFCRQAGLNAMAEFFASKKYVNVGGRG
jgi:hypothetical protein